MAISGTPTDQDERLAAGRRRRRTDAVPGPLRPASAAYVSHLLDPCGVPPRMLRSTRLLGLVNTMDPKLVAAVFGMDAESVMIYLADRVDPGRLPDQPATRPQEKMSNPLPDQGSGTRSSKPSGSCTAGRPSFTSRPVTGKPFCELPSTPGQGPGSRAPRLTPHGIPGRRHTVAARGVPLGRQVRRANGRRHLPSPCRRRDG
jgi:hypothetical protein